MELIKKDSLEKRVFSWVLSRGCEDNILGNRRQCSDTGLNAGMSEGIGIDEWVILAEAQSLSRENQKRLKWN